MVDVQIAQKVLSKHEEIPEQDLHSDFAQSHQIWIFK
jgi:hypothetical protein